MMSMTRVMANDYPTVSYDMGFMVDNMQIPDPTSFSGKESDLDSMGERDANGYLHRNRVATKHPLSIEYKNIPWGLITRISGLLMQEKFTFRFPNPFSIEGYTDIEAYAGDRNFTAVWSPEGQEWIGDLKVSIIEY